jgi:hypothetical protein
VIKTASFHVRATEAQSVRWKRAADSEGLASVGNWLARAADAHLELRARAGLPLPLAWAKGRFPALLDGELRELRGWVAPPFGFFRGNATGPKAVGAQLYTLAYTPTGRLLATFRYAAHCKALASDLARTWVRWDGARAEPPSRDSAPIVARHLSEAK